MTAQVIRRGTATWPGGSLEYQIWIWSNVKAAKVTATIDRSSKSILAPRFGQCPAVRHSRCTIGSIPRNTAYGLNITDLIAKSATIGQQLTVTADVSATSMSPAEASISFVVVGRSTPTPVPTVTVTVPSTSAPGVPGTTVTPGGLGGLFPTVTPAASPTHGSAPAKRKTSKVITTASSLPLDPRLLGGQVVGLAVLAAAITMVVARLSLRTPAPATPGGPAAAAAPPPPEPAEEPEAAGHAE